jgi:hypothetical protein
MAEAYESESLEAFEFESEFESESESESESEAARRGPWRSPARAPGRLYTPRPTSNPVSQVQLQAALSRVSEQLRKSSGAINTVNSRVNAVNKSEKKDNANRQKDLKSINEKIQLLALLPLLLKPTAKPLDGTQLPGGLATGDKVLVDTGDTLTALLPLLLIGGFGSSGLATGSGSSDGGMDGATLLVLALALSGSLNRSN